MKNFEALVFNTNEDREPFSPGATEAGFNTTRSNVKNKINVIGSSTEKRTVVEIKATTGVNNTRSNIKN